MLSLKLGLEFVLFSNVPLCFGCFFLFHHVHKPQKKTNFVVLIVHLANNLKACDVIFLPYCLPLMFFYSLHSFVVHVYATDSTDYLILKSGLLNQSTPWPVQSMALRDWVFFTVFMSTVCLFLVYLTEIVQC